MIVAPRASMRAAPAGIGTVPARPSALIRLPSITMVPFSMTPVVGPPLRPAPPPIVTRRAPSIATAPSGTSDAAVKPIGTPFASGSSGFSRPLSRKVKVCDRSRE